MYSLSLSFLLFFFKLNSAPYAKTQIISGSTNHHGIQKWLNDFLSLLLLNGRNVYYNQSTMSALTYIRIYRPKQHRMLKSYGSQRRHMEPRYFTKTSCVFCFLCFQGQWLHVLNGMGYSECTIYATDAVHLPPNNIASAYVQMMRANPSWDLRLMRKTKP